LHYLAQLADASVETIMHAWCKWQFAKWAQLNRLGKLRTAKWRWLLKVAHRIGRNAEPLELPCDLLGRAITAAEQQYWYVKLSPESKDISYESLSSLKEKLQHAIKAQTALQRVLGLTFPTEPLKAQIEFQDVLGEVFEPEVRL
jgi:hypothetical protein